MKKLLLLLSAFSLTACTGIPEGIQPISNFELPQYLGRWYEIARLDHSFEKGMQQVTATYEMREDGGVRVLNEGFLTGKNAWDQAEGKAYFVESENIGHLKVSFFGPFYGSYIIFELGESYEYAFVTSTNKSFLWLLSREPVIEQELQQRFINTVATLGYDIEALIWVDQSVPESSVAFKD
jgi:apolipoprotein D and lipocalin family protein